MADGYRWRTPWMPAEIYEKMCLCDDCGREGEIFGDSPSIWLVWNFRGNQKVICLWCRDKAKQK